MSPNRFEMNLENVVITGASIGLPGSNRKVFDENNFSDIVEGTNFIDSIPDSEQKKILDKNIKKIVKDEQGNRIIKPINKSSQIHKLAGLKGFIDLEKDYNIPKAIVLTLDKTYELAIAAGLEALKDAKIPLVPQDRNLTGSKGWELPKAYQKSTGIIFASSFPVLDAISQEITNYLENKLREEFVKEIKQLHVKLQLESQTHQEKIFTDFLNVKKDEISGYQFDRKILFKLLVMGNAQLAQIIKAKGPNTTLNAACASTSQAVTLAEDWIKLGRCERVIVVGADDPTSDNLLQWIGTGFLILGAASTKEKVEDAALPFDKRRNGMILGMGAVGLVVESEISAKNRGIQPLCKVLGTHMANSAYHGTALDINHVSAELEEFISRMEKVHNLQRKEMSKKLVYMSHETFTFANGGAAKAEIDALNYVFRENLSNIIISNTKGYTGHPMGVGLEDAIAAYALKFNKIPPIANLKEKDPDLGDLKYATKSDEDFRYILRFAAGFGSQMVYLLLQKYEEKMNNNRYEEWLRELFDGQVPVTNKGGILKSYLE
ncbi:MAG: 3-oxoacyl-[acyl-carrier-protein] synthase 2 [Candidatus Heimdallarchaeota archaeon LC_2]|nr:MAG: 3-oxoacyl-[acyl-carrier-protein] synthase 2 [Candidatus Heimdallarchaeota archaeon LC_2]